VTTIESRRAIHLRFIAKLKPPFKFSFDDRAIGSGYRPMGQARRSTETGARTGEASMARWELPELMEAGLGEAPATADTLFELGMMHASGRSVPVDLVTAHKWFNIAAMKGHAEAARLRREVAAEMADAEIGQAQRAARDWLKAHPEPAAAVVLSLRAAA
jgi:TPR repeat protein